MRITLVFASVLAAVGSISVSAAPVHSLSIFGDAKYPDNFTHFEYANPDAPKGGKVTLPGLGSYDTFNPFGPKGDPAQEMGLTFATLMQASEDEPNTVYPYLADSVEIRDDGLTIDFSIRDGAQFHDKTAIRAQDVAATFTYLKSEGQPYYAAYYRDVKAVSAPDAHHVVFTLASNKNRELPVILGQLPVLKAGELAADADRGAHTPFTGSGPYRVDNFQFGQFITFKRVDGLWSESLPVMRGRYNFDEVRVDFYRDENVILEALKSGRIDVHLESSSKRWKTAYVGERFDSGALLKKEISHKKPVGLQAFAMNTRRANFSDVRVRTAMGLAFDYEWSNANLFYGAYTRTTSYFANSDCQSQGTPSKEELALLEPWRQQLPPSLFLQPHDVPQTDGSGNARQNLKKAIQLLNDAGWKIVGNKLVDGNGKPFVFELLITSADFERVALPYKANLQKIGITMNIRLMDTSQYIRALRQFDFDMIVHAFPQSASPGNEQRDYWHSSMASTVASRNVMGVSSPVVDDLIEKLITADSRAHQLASCRALDRVLLWGEYVVPQWYIPYHRVAYQNRFGMPAIAPSYSDFGLYEWWIK